ncbi:MAG: hypothetical protein Fur0018_11130 [Anaerolineales bacterium]
MQIRCMYCGTPFALGEATLRAALEKVVAEDLKYYEARCPRCRKANRLSREQLEHEVPNRA